MDLDAVLSFRCAIMLTEEMEDVYIIIVSCGCTYMIFGIPVYIERKMHMYIHGHSRQKQ